MNKALVEFLGGLGVKTQARDTRSLFVSREDVDLLGGTTEVLSSLRTELNDKKLFWEDTEATQGWYVLKSF